MGSAETTLRTWMHKYKNRIWLDQNTTEKPVDHDAIESETHDVRPADNVEPSNSSASITEKTGIPSPNSSISPNSPKIIPEIVINDETYVCNEKSQFHDSKSQISPQALTRTKTQHSDLLNSSKEDKFDPDQAEFKITARFICCITFLMSCLCLSALDYTGTGNIMAAVASDLGGTTSQTEWIGNGYALSACVAQLPVVALSEVFGRRNVIMVTLALFLLGSILCAVAHNMDTLITGRVIQGMGAAGNLVIPEVVLADVVPLRLRGIFYGIGMAIWFISSGAAPMIAGAFTQYVTWRWFYYLNVILGGPLLLIAPLAVKLTDLEGTLKERIKKIDWIGAFLSVTSMTSILIGLSRGDSSADITWSHWSVVLSLVLGFAGLVATVLYEYYAKPVLPMFNVHVYGNWTAIFCFLHNIIQGIVDMAAVYFLPTFFQGCKNLPELESGAAILPLGVAGPPFGLLVGWIMAKTGHYQWMTIFFWMVCIAGFGLMSTVSEFKSIASLVCMQILVSVGINSLYTTMSITANASNPPRLWTESTAMMCFCRSIGDAFGTAIGGAIIASEMRSRISALSSEGVQLPDDVSIMSIVGDINKVSSETVRADLKAALSGSMRILFIVLTAFCAVGFITSLFQKEYTLDEEHISKQAIDQSTPSTDSESNQS